MIDVKVKFYSLTNYSGIPAPLKDKFASEPLLPHSLLSAFDHLLGPALIATGVMLLLGLGTRLSLFVQGLISVSYTHLDVYKRQVLAQLREDFFQRRNRAVPEAGCRRDDEQFFRRGLQG